MSTTLAMRTPPNWFITGQTTRRDLRPATLLWGGELLIMGQLLHAQSKLYFCSEAVQFCVHLVQVWYRFGTGLAQVWHRFGTGLVQVWYRFGIGFVQVWYRFGIGLVQVYSVLQFKFLCFYQISKTSFYKKLGPAGLRERTVKLSFRSCKSFPVQSLLAGLTLSNKQNLGIPQVFPQTYVLMLRERICISLLQGLDAIPCHITYVL